MTKPFPINEPKQFQKRLIQVTEYRDDGNLIWKIDRTGGTKSGSVAGGERPGPTGKMYRLIRFEGRKYMAHRLIWVYFHGEDPGPQMDHADGNSLNNRIENLRPSTALLNARNKRMLRNNTTGVCGVWMSKTGKFMAAIMVDRNRIHLGCFETLEDAAAARKAAEFEYGFDENHGKNR